MKKLMKRDGIREAVGENVVDLFNTYTYERLRLKGASATFWKQLSTQPVRVADESHNSVIRFLEEKWYIEVYYES